MLEPQPTRLRANLRRAVRVRCEAVAERGFRRIGTLIHDLSEEGALVRLERLVQIGDEVYLSFQAPKTRAWVDACARVVRLERGRREGDLGSAAGLRFESISPLDRALLAGALHALPPPLPRRRRSPDYASFVASI